MCDTAGIDDQRASGANIAASCRTSFLNNLLAPEEIFVVSAFPPLLIFCVPLLMLSP